MPASTPSPWASSELVSRKLIFEAEASAAFKSSGPRLAISTSRSGTGVAASRGSAVAGKDAAGATVSGCSGGATSACPAGVSRLSKIERSSGAPGLVSGMINPWVLVSGSKFDHTRVGRHRTRMRRQVRTRAVLPCIRRRGNGCGSNHTAIERAGNPKDAIFFGEEGAHIADKSARDLGRQFDRFAGHAVKIGLQAANRESNRQRVRPLAVPGTKGRGAFR